MINMLPPKKKTEGCLKKKVNCELFREPASIRKWGGGGRGLSKKKRNEETP